MVKRLHCKQDIAGSSPVESYPFMNTNSPIDPLYWFKNDPGDFDAYVFDENNKWFLIEPMQKWRFLSKNADKKIFTCEVVGGTSCGLKFFLPEEIATAAERVD
jgi:hypothetical protein